MDMKSMGRGEEYVKTIIKISREICKKHKHSIYNFRSMASTKNASKFSKKRLTKI